MQTLRTRVMLFLALGSAAAQTACDVALISGEADDANGGGPVGTDNTPGGPSQDGGAPSSASRDADAGALSPGDATNATDVVDGAASSNPGASDASYDVGPVNWPNGTPPFPIPNIGEAVAIGTNTANDVRPAGVSTTSWGYSTFNAYGGGTFASGYSFAGAYVIASSGGHNAPGNVDALIFDFADATWKRLANAHGVSFLSSDVGESATSGGPWFELDSASPSGLPAPSHTYNTISYIPPALGGGPRGSLLKMGQWATTTTGTKGGGIHKLDLATGVWSRVATSLPSNDYENVVVHDELANRYYFFELLVHRRNDTVYLDPATWTLKTTPAYAYPADHRGDDYITVFHDPVRKLLILQQEGYPMRCLQTDNFGAGWKDLTSTGAPPPPNRIVYYPPTGNFYTRGNKDGSSIYRLRPPAGDPFSGTWTWDKVTVTGVTPPDFTSTGSNDNRRHYSTFFYVPLLGSLAWISGEATKVILLKPPA